MIIHKIIRKEETIKIYFDTCVNFRYVLKLGYVKYNLEFGRNYQWIKQNLKKWNCW